MLDEKALEAAITAANEANRLGNVQPYAVLKAIEAYFKAARSDVAGEVDEITDAAISRGCEILWFVHPSVLRPGMDARDFKPIFKQALRASLSAMPKQAPNPQPKADVAGESDER